MLSAVMVAVLGSGDLEAMSLDELLVEDVRLELRPSLVPPATMLGLGLGAAAVSFTTMGLAVYDLSVLARMPRTFREDGFGPEFWPGITEVFACIHGAFGALLLVGGVLWFPSRMNAAEAATLDRSRIRARITELDAQGATHDPIGVARQQLALIDEAYPNNALPGQLFAAGCLATIAGLLSLAFVHNNASAISSGLAELVMGGGLIGVGSWILSERNRERDALDARREKLRARVGHVR